ncbi:EVE domain-containing protein [Marinobacter daqiaonensis]|nr:EVE domain-containing protein [Marinobacter daqiaonensis]
MKSTTALQSMPLVRKGNRLSVMPVDDAEWQTIRGLCEQ